MERLSIPEVLKSLEGKSKEDRRKILNLNRTRALRIVLYIAFSDRLKDILLPNERPTFELDENSESSNLYIESRKFKIFLKGSGYDSLDSSKRETLFLEMLKSVSPEESEFLLQLFIDKKIKSDLKLEEVLDVYPNLIPKTSSTPSEQSTDHKEEQNIDSKVSSKDEKKSYKNLSEVYESASDSKEEKEPESFKNLSEVYEKKSEKKTKTKKKSSKKKKSK